MASLATANVLVQPAQDKGFSVQYTDVFVKYLMPPVKPDSMVKTWSSNPMQFWQNQLNFAVWCATTGCGVSSEDHLSAGDPLMKSLFRFHAYYRIRWILDEMKAPLPQDHAWDATNNPCDLRAYERGLSAMTLAYLRAATGASEVQTGGSEQSFYTLRGWV